MTDIVQGRQRPPSLRVFVSRGFDPVLNLAMEDWIFSELPAGTYALYLWMNRDVVVIGRYQNPWKECNLAAMERDGVVLMRRTSGGGAVFNDTGNLNFTFLSPSQEYSKERNSAIVIRALARFGVNAYVSGRNDILAEDRKISGSAYRETREKCFHHGTLLVRADLGRLARYLTPDPRKLASKGIESVRSRVGNLADFAPTMELPALQDAIIEEFFAEYGSRCPVESLDGGFLEREAGLRAAYERLGSDEWRFGTTPDFTHELSTRFPWGGFDVLLSVRRGCIESATVYSDCLDTTVPEALMAAFAGVPYGASTAREVGRRLAGAGLGCESVAELEGWLAAAVGGTA